MVGPVATAGLKPAYGPSEVTASAGDVTFLLRNVASAQADPPAAHNFVLGVEAPQFTGRDWVLAPAIAQSPPVGVNKSVVLTVENLAPGTYAFWCTIEGHFTAGMVGTLVVTP